ncbi:MAG TPA: hypothetical protein VI759_03595 [Dehalococcoidia bacterium]|nr:hypothetical protein [Dehalococcoidia bacterium]
MVEDRTPFSQRYDARPLPSEPIYDSVPARVQVGIGNIAISLATQRVFGLERIFGIICSEIDTPIPGILEQHNQTVFTIMNKLTWYELCDVCEALYESVEALNSERANRFQHDINKVFARNGFGYEMRHGQVEHIGAFLQEEVIAETRLILSDPELAGPSEQFQDALRYYNARPKPDLDNAVKEAISAVEGLTRILLNDPKIVLSKALLEIRQKKGVHPALVEIIAKVYAYRGDVEGIAHGATAPSQITFADAEFVIGSAGNAIIYLARLFGRGRP